jgi:hypothetical protein
MSLKHLLVTVARSGHIDEWHLLLSNSFQEITFGLWSWFSEEAVVFRAPFSEARFIPVGAIRHSLAGDCVEQLLVEDPAEFRVVFAQQSNHRLEGARGHLAVESE